MEKRLVDESPYENVSDWQIGEFVDRLSPFERAKRDAREVSELHRAEIARKILELTHSA
jgi:hypothetical protein